MRSVSSTPSSSSWKGSGVERLITSSSSTCTSISPVGMSRVDGLGACAGRPRPCPDDELVAQLVRGGGGRGGALGVDDELHEPAFVAQVDEDQPAVVAAARHPTGERDACGRRRSDVSLLPIASRHVTWPLRVAASSARATVCSASLPSRRIGDAVGADDRDRRRAGAPGLRHLALERACLRSRGRSRRRGGAARRSDGQNRDALRVVGHDEEDVERLRRGIDSFVLEREQQSLEAGAEADARGRRTADRLDEAVVPPSAADRRVGVLVGPDELERRPRVVVEATHERRVERRTARRTRRARAAPASKCARHSSHSDSPIFGASSSAARTLGVFTSNTCSGLVARLWRASSSSTSACASSHAFSCGRRRRAGSSASPIELSRSSHFVTPSRRSSSW